MKETTEVSCNMNEYELFSHWLKAFYERIEKREDKDDIKVGFKIFITDQLDEMEMEDILMCVAGLSNAPETKNEKRDDEKILKLFSQLGSRHNN